MQGFGQPSALEAPLCRSLSLLGQCTLSHFLLSPLIELSVKTEGWLFLWALHLVFLRIDQVPFSMTLGQCPLKYYS